MTDKIKIIVADDQDLFRKGICSLLKEEDNFEIIFEATSGLDLVNYLKSNKNHPNVILMDMKMPYLNGVEATKQISADFPTILIIALSSYITQTFITSMLSSGAVSYLPKNASPLEMITTINKVFQNGFYYNKYMLHYLSKEQLNAIQNKSNYFEKDFFTKKELEILQLICKQKSTLEIADVLTISPRTVEGHRNNMLLKTDCKSSVGLVIFALQNEIVTLNDTLEI